MPQIILTEVAIQGLERCREFLHTKAPEAAKRAAQTITQHLQLLETAPEIGRPDEEAPQLRELVMPFGDSGYVALYHYNPTSDEIYILAFRHQKEAGY